MISTEAIVGTLFGLGMSAFVVYRVRQKQQQAEKRTIAKAHHERNRTPWRDSAAGQDDDDSWDDVQPVED